MNSLQEFNQSALQKYKNLNETGELACPLLVSSNSEYLNNLNSKIFYIGQETNCWVNYQDHNMDITTNLLEDTYLNFLKKGATNRDFWSFIKTCLNIDDSELINSVIWSNTFLCGKRREIGHPNPTKELMELSINYLTFLYNYFKPEYTIIVNGPRNPYYAITIEFLKQIKSTLIDYYPTMSNSLLVDDNKNVIWTYHPNFQRRKGIQNEIVNKINTKMATK